MFMGNEFSLTSHKFNMMVQKDKESTSKENHS